MSSAPLLPPDANLHQLKNQAKELCRASRKGDPTAVQRLRQSHPGFARLTETELADTHIALGDAQLVIARELGFETWPKLKRHVESLSRVPNMHELVTGQNEQAWQQVIAQDPQAVNQRNKSGLPPLYTAALYRNQQAVDFLLAHGAVVDLFACAYLGKADDADRLLNIAPDLVNTTTPNGMTALHYAAMAGHVDVVDVLLHYRAAVNAIDQDGSTPLMEACHAGPWKPEPAEEIVQRLLDHEPAHVDLNLAAAMGRADLIESILNRDSGLIDTQDTDGNTALFHAARNNRFDAVKLLVQRGADVNRSDAVGIAALHRTSQECSDELIQYLIDHGADAHLCCYVACGDEDGTRRALARDPSAPSEIFYEYNAVGYAIHCWQLRTLRILLETGCTLSKEDQELILEISENQELLDRLLAMQRG